MSETSTNAHPPGFEDAMKYPFFETVFRRRTRRISRGIGKIPAGTLTYETSSSVQPLTPLEEAMLIAVTGVTGWTMADGPTQTPDGKPLLGTPNIEVMGRAASSADNAQSTHFFLINDSGTYFLKAPNQPVKFWNADGKVDPDLLVAAAESAKHRISDRIDFPRAFPAYLGRNRYVSNVPGSTILVPVVDLTRQYINGFMYLLSQQPGERPTFIDDWNFYRIAGDKKWVRNGFLNQDQKIPLGLMHTFRITIEADLLLQNIMLAIQAMGLGGWIHAAFPPPMLLGHPEYVRFGKGLGFRYEQPRRTLIRRIKQLITPLPAWSPNPVGLDGLLEGFCPPYYPNMSKAVDAILEKKYGQGGTYQNPRPWEEIFQEGLAETYLREVPHYTPEVIECTKDLCNYIYDTYGRFPAHVDAMYVPGVWVQAHHVDEEYYERFFRDGLSATQRQHQERWHENNMGGKS